MNSIIIIIITKIMNINSKTFNSEKLHFVETDISENLNLILTDISENDLFDRFINFENERVDILKYYFNGGNFILFKKIIEESGIFIDSNIIKHIFLEAIQWHYFKQYSQDNFENYDNFIYFFVVQHKIDINLNNGETFYKFFNGSKNNLDILIKYGYKVNNNKFILNEILDGSYDTEFVRYILDIGFDLNDSKYYSTYTYIFYKNKFELIDILIEYGLNLFMFLEIKFLHILSFCQIKILFYLESKNIDLNYLLRKIKMASEQEDFQFVQILKENNFTENQIYNIFI